MSSLTLVDADTNQPISPFNPIANGATINRATLPTQNLTIQANTTPSTVGSVVFDLVEAKYFNTANASPYDLCGSVPCSNLGVGLHSLNSTPYMGSNGTGGAGTPLSISFSVIDPTPTPTPTPTPIPSPTPTPTVRTTTLTLTSANNGQTFTNYRISTTSGPCVTITGATNVTISDSNIGPCGQNNSDNDSTGIEMSGGSGINIYDSYIHVENLAFTNSYSQTHSHSNIEAGGRGGSSPTTNVTIQGNVICFGAANIRASNGSNNWIVNGNFLCNPRARDGSGDDFQQGDSYGALVENNYMYGCIRPADASTFPYSSATSAMPVCPAAFNSFYSEDLEDTVNSFYSAPQTNKSATYNNNYMFGEFPGPASVAIDGSVANYKGSCIEVDQNSHAVTASNNTLLESVGLVHDSGDGGFTATNNTVWSNNAPNPQIVAAVDTNGGGVANFGPCVWTGNILTTHGGTNDNNYYWGGVSPQCSSLPGYVFSGNTVGAAADTALGLNSSMSAAQVAAIIPPPLIPPLPKNCVVKSPFSTQTSMAACP